MSTPRCSVSLLGGCYHVGIVRELRSPGTPAAAPCVPGRSVTGCCVRDCDPVTRRRVRGSRPLVVVLALFRSSADTVSVYTVYFSDNTSVSSSSAVGVLTW